MPSVAASWEHFRSGGKSSPRRRRRWFQERGGAQFTVPEIHPLDVRDEIEYVSARFEAVTVMAAMQKPIKQEDGSNENNRKPQRAREMKNQLGSLTSENYSLRFLACPFLRHPRIPSVLMTSYLSAWAYEVPPSTADMPSNLNLPSSQ